MPVPPSLGLENKTRDVNLAAEINAYSTRYQLQDSNRVHPESLQTGGWPLHAKQVKIIDEAAVSEKQLT